MSLNSGMFLAPLLLLVLVGKGKKRGEKIMNFKNIKQKLIIIITVLITSVSAFADRGNVSQDISVLQDAKRAVLQDYNFNYASYRIRLVKIKQVRLQRTNERQQLLNTLDVTMDKINDRRISLNDKVYIVVDCLTAAIGILQNIESGNRGPSRGSKLDQVIRQYRQVVLLVESNQVNAGINILYEIERTLLRYPQNDSKLNSASDIVDLTINKMSDRYMTLGEKISIIQDCYQAFKRDVSTSSYYQRETQVNPRPRPGTGPRPRPQPRPRVQMVGVYCFRASRNTWACKDDQNVCRVQSYRSAQHAAQLFPGTCGVRFQSGTRFEYRFRR